MVMTKLDLGTDKMIGEKGDGIGWMTFNQPERRNAVSQEMRAAIIRILDDFENDDDVRVIVLTGAGDKAFVSGSDISKSEKGDASVAELEEQGKLSQRVQERYDTLTKPMIAMIRGYCLGGGVGIALQADLRIASSDAQFGVPAARLGNAYNWNYTKKLVETVGPARAKEFLITARRYSAEEALNIGFLHRVVAPGELEAAVREVALQIAANAPLAVRAAKFTVDEAAKDESTRDMAGVRAARKLCIESADFAEGRRAFNEKRAPTWTGR